MKANIAKGESWILLVAAVLIFLPVGRANAAVVYRELTAAVGYTGLSGVDLPKAPMLAQYSIGGMIGYRFANFFLGLSSDIRFINQYSEVADSGGNWRGNRWNIVSPTLAYYTPGFAWKFDYQFMGDYNLSSATVAGVEGAKYTSPSGFRLQTLWKMTPTVWLGLQAEQVTFKSSNAPTSGTSDAGLTVWQVGPALTFAL